MHVRRSAEGRFFRPKTLVRRRGHENKPRARTHTHTSHNDASKKHTHTHSRAPLKETRVVKYPSTHHPPAARVVILVWLTIGVHNGRNDNPAHKHFYVRMLALPVLACWGVTPGSRRRILHDSRHEHDVPVVEKRVFACAQCAQIT